MENNPQSRLVNKRQLTNHLSSAVKSAVQEQKNGNDAVSNDVTNTICNILEAIFIHALKESYFIKNKSLTEKYPEPNFWPFVQKFTHRNIRAQIGNLNQIKSDIGRARVWLRIALNDGLLENYIASVTREPQIVKHYYNRNAFLRDSEEIEVMSNYVRALSKLSFKAPVNSNMLNSWTPTPLKLAGLIENEKYHSSSDSDINDVMSALEFEGLEDSRMMSDTYSDSTSVVFSGAVSPESVRKKSIVDQSIMSDGDSVLSSLPESSPLNEPDWNRETRLQSILDSLIAKNSAKVVEPPTPPVIRPDASIPFITTTEASPTDITTNDEEPSFISDLPPRTVDSPSRLLESPLQNSFDEEESVKSKQPADDVFEQSNELECSFSPGNSLQNSRFYRWSSGLMEAESRSTNYSNDNLDTSSPARENSFSETVNKILDETSSLAVTEDDAEKPDNMENVNEVKDADQPETAELGSDLCESSSDYVVVHNLAPNIEPAEKAFRTSFLTKISNEVGLTHQDYKCNGCRRSIGLMFGSYRLCHFDGHYYCSDCHLDEESVIPAKALFNWDLKPRKVCRASKAFLDHVADQPLIRLSQSNPTLFNVIEKMKEVKALRLQLSYAAIYLLTCREIVAEDLRKRIWPKEYLYQDADLFSITDLINASSGQLQKHLKSVIHFATKHVLETCPLCANKGFVCEICNDSKIIYPFQMDITQRCTKCCTVYHKTCADGRPCPKCLRRELCMKTNLDSGIEMPPFGDA